MIRPKRRRIQNLIETRSKSDYLMIYFTVLSSCNFQQQLVKTRALFWMAIPEIKTMPRVFSSLKFRIKSHLLKGNLSIHLHSQVSPRTLIYYQIS